MRHCVDDCHYGVSLAVCISQTNLIGCRSTAELKSPIMHAGSYSTQSLVLLLTHISKIITVCIFKLNLINFFKKEMPSFCNGIAITWGQPAVLAGAKQISTYKCKFSNQPINFQMNLDERPAKEFLHLPCCALSGITSLCSSPGSAKRLCWDNKV